MRTGKWIIAIAFIFCSILLFTRKGLAVNQNNVVVLNTTKGYIEIELRPDIAPKAVENFETLVKKKYYNGLLFHRVIKNFMIQSGDPTGTGRGGQSIWGKPFKNEIQPGVTFDKDGVLAMANAGPDTNGSQFFITTVPAPWLNGKYTIFGYVVDGMDTVHAIENVKTGPGDRPVEDVKITEAYMKW